MTDRIKALTALLVNLGLKAGDATISDLAATFEPKQYSTNVWYNAWDAYNGSFDAFIALHSAVVPELEWNASSDGVASVWGPVDNRLQSFVGRSSTPARAGLIAVIEALIATAEQKETP